MVFEWHDPKDEPVHNKCDTFFEEVISVFAGLCPKSFLLFEEI